MSPEEKKSLAHALLFASNDGDVEKVDSLTTDDFYFQFMMKGEITPDGGEVASKMPKEYFLKHGVPMTMDITEDGMHFEVDRAICEGDTVALFGRSNAMAKNGRKYSNTYCWRFTFSGDKVSEFLEFCDTHYAVATLFS